MKLNWASVKVDHVTRACEELYASSDPKPRPGGLVVRYRDKQLPAKAVLRLAYGLANKSQSQTPLKFASGEASLKFLQSLGFEAERLSTSSATERR
jgi:hypothetical protein